VGIGVLVGNTTAVVKTAVGVGVKVGEGVNTTVFVKIAVGVGVIVGDGVNTTV
jgi:hypothetical protein